MAALLSSSLAFIESVRDISTFRPEWTRWFLCLIASRSFLNGMYRAQIVTLVLFFMIVWFNQLANELGFGSSPSRKSPDYHPGGKNLPEGIPYTGQMGVAAYLVHVLPGIVYFAVGAIQFSSNFRQKWPRTHRLLGIAFFLVQAVSAIGVLLLWVFVKLQGGLAIWWTVPFGLSLWVYSAYKAFISAVYHDIPAHERWIIRSFYLGWGIIFSRPWTALAFTYQAIFRSHIPRDRQWDVEDVLGSAIVALFQILPLAAEIQIYAMYGEGFLASASPSMGWLSEGVKEPAIKLTQVDTKVVRHVSGSYFVTPLRPAPAGTFVGAKVAARHVYSSSTILLRLQLTTRNTFIDIPPAHHISLRASMISRRDDHSDTIRSYTPISTKFEHMNGVIDLLVSVAPNGVMSSYLETIPIGGELQVLGTATGRIDVPRIVSPIHSIRRMILIAGGSGIAPIFSMVRAAFDVDQLPTCQITVLYYPRRNCKERNEPLRDELEQYAARSNGALDVQIKTGDLFVPSQLSVFAGEGKHDKAVDEMSWDRETGVTARWFVSGPVEMEKKCIKYLVGECGISRDLVFAFGLNGR
ncbi:hypothetical protein BJ742DRAFT_770050 [Cladochytrium replicatum]|nr:hypothetical protein BJ742DRAFT_770050 [Cladochytrium replicatum]